MADFDTTFILFRSSKGWTSDKNCITFWFKSHLRPSLSDIDLIRADHMNRHWNVETPNYQNEKTPYYMVSFTKFLSHFLVFFEIWNSVFGWYPQTMMWIGLNFSKKKRFKHFSSWMIELLITTFLIILSKTVMMTRNWIFLNSFLLVISPTFVKIS